MPRLILVAGPKARSHQISGLVTFYLNLIFQWSGVECGQIVRSAPSELQIALDVTRSVCGGSLIIVQCLYALAEDSCQYMEALSRSSLATNH